MKAVSDVNAATGVEKFETINSLSFAPPTPAAKHRKKNPHRFRSLPVKYLTNKGLANVSALLNGRKSPPHRDTQPTQRTAYTV